MHTKRDSVSRGLPVDPEADKGDDDEQTTRNIHVDHEVAHVPLQLEVDEQLGESSCNKQEKNGLIYGWGRPPQPQLN